MPQRTATAHDTPRWIRRCQLDHVLSSNVVRRFFVALAAGLSLTAIPSWAATLDEAFKNLRITVPQQRLAAPDFTLLNPAGQSLRLSDYRGNVVLLNFWASYCAPCRAEMPAMQALWRRYREQGLVILAVAADKGSAAPVQDFLAELAIDFPVLLDGEGTVREQYQVTALPTTYLIGRDGKFLGRVLGAREWNDVVAHRLVSGLLQPRIPSVTGQSEQR